MDDAARFDARIVDAAVQARVLLGRAAVSAGAPAASTRTSASGSSSPRQASVAVIRKPPSTRALMLPVVPWT